MRKTGSRPETHRRFRAVFKIVQHVLICVSNFLYLVEILQKVEYDNNDTLKTERI